MQIRYVQSGGFAGLRKTGVVDTRMLPADEAKRLESLVESAGFFSLPKKGPRQKKGADYLTYTLTIEDGARSHSVEVNEHSASESLHELIRSVTTLKKA